MSFVVRAPSGDYLHHNYVVALLSDLFGIQTRGGCSCAGPYGHRLLGIDLERSHEFERQIATGCEGIKPGWVRVNFNYFVDDEVFDYIVEAVRLVATDGWRLLGDYRFEPATGLWRHKDGAGRAAAAAERRVVRRRRHHDLRAARHHRAGRACWPTTWPRRAASWRRRRPCDSSPAHLSADFDALRWFDLPRESLAHSSGSSTHATR